MKLNQRGFTLLELVIGMAVLALVIGAIGGILSASIRSFQYNFDEGAKIQDVRSILTRSSNELRNATAIKSPSTDDHADTIVYQLAGDIANRTIALGTGADAGYILFIDASGAIQKLGAGRVKSIDFISDFVPNGSNPPCKRQIRIRVQVKDDTKTGSRLSDLTTTVVTYNAF